MSDCISLIDNRVDLKKVAQWVTVKQMTHVLHIEEVTIRSVAGGHLDITPFCVDNMDCRIIGAIVYHCCGTGLIHSWDSEVIRHTRQEGTQTCISLDCWELNPACVAEDPDMCWIADPCKRLEQLRCCQMEWLKLGKKTQWSFRDSSGSTSFLSESRLMAMISQAETECEQLSCMNSRSIGFRCNNVLSR